MAKKREIRVFGNLAASLDGKIADRAHPSRPLGTAFDRKTMGKIREQADVVIYGAETLRAYTTGVKYKKKDGRYLVNAIISRSGTIDPNLPFWSDPKIIRFVFTCTGSYQAAVKSTRDRAFIIEAGEASVDPKKVLDVLMKAGFTNFLVEGGGQTVRSFLDAKLLNELYLTITPTFLGGSTNPSLVGGDLTLTPWVKGKILSSKRVKDELYMHYKILS